MFNKKIVIIIVLFLLAVLISALVFWLLAKQSNQPAISSEPVANQSEAEQADQLVSQLNNEPTDNEPGAEDTTAGANTGAEEETVIIGDYFLATYQFFIGPDEESQSLVARVRADSQLDKLSYQINETGAMEQTDIQKIFVDCAKVNYNYQPWPILCDCVRQKCYFGQSDIDDFLAELTK